MAEITFAVGAVYYYKGSINGELTIRQEEDGSIHAYSEYGEEMVEHYGSLTGFFKKIVDILEDKEA